MEDEKCKNCKDRAACEHIAERLIPAALAVMARFVITETELSHTFSRLFKNSDDSFHHMLKVTTKFMLSYAEEMAAGKVPTDFETADASTMGFLKQHMEKRIGAH